MKGSARFTIALGRAVDTVVITVHGELDQPGAQHLDSVLSDLFNGEDAVKVIIDLHDARAADPDALSVFNRAAALADSRSGTLVLSNPLDSLDAALEAAGVARLISREDGRRAPWSPPDGDRTDHGEHGDHPANGGHGRTPPAWRT